MFVVLQMPFVEVDTFSQFEEYFQDSQCFIAVKYRKGDLQFLTIKYQTKPQMNINRNFTHSTVKNTYAVSLEAGEKLRIKLEQKYSLNYWQGDFSLQNIKDITFKTGNELFFQEFVNILVKALEQKDISCYLDILTSQDLQNLRAKKTNQPLNTTSNTRSNPSKSNKRYLILTYMVSDNKFHYPLSLTCHQIKHDVDSVKKIYDELRLQLQSARNAALNETHNKTQNSFSIEYDKKNNGRYEARMKQVDQIKSQNQILKAKLARLEEQAIKKKANIEIQAAIERTKDLKQKLETANLDLVDWKNKITDQEQAHIDLKSQMAGLHKKICKLLTTEKELGARKKGEETEKDLMLSKNITKKNGSEIDRLKKELQASKTRTKELQMKAKKLTSEKNVLQRGSRRGPYSSAGSVRSYGSYNSYGSRNSYGSSNNNSLSKPRSNYSYSSNRFR